MFLGVLLAGMGFGAVAAGWWLMSGGSVLVALALYALVGTVFVLGAAVLSFCLPEKKPADARADALQPAE